ncbi:hypothetical protein AB6A40_011011 [Gnathostoma spinigerum]|uniref:Uncharacterized protein n=1 Tax=Gnathostoma spinigerum TaxID=75299 RepID=A0ABD6F3F1_9BILA
MEGWVNVNTDVSVHQLLNVLIMILLQALVALTVEYANRVRRLAVIVSSSGDSHFAGIFASITVNPLFVVNDEDQRNFSEAESRIRRSFFHSLNNAALVVWYFRTLQFL